MAGDHALAVEPVAAKSTFVAPLEEAESTDVSSSEDAIVQESDKLDFGKVTTRISPKGRRLVQWSDLLDARMLAGDSEMDMEDSEGPEHHDDHTSEVEVHGRDSAADIAGDKDVDGDVQGLSSAHSKRRARRRRRNVKASTAESAMRSPTTGLARPSEGRDNSMSYIYPNSNMPSQFAGLSTHCNGQTSSLMQAGKPQVTCFDILGQDYSLSPKASSPHAHGGHVAMASQAPTMPTCTVTMQQQACPTQATQAMLGSWMEPARLAGSIGCEAGARTIGCDAWHTPLVTPWNPPYWESPVNAYADQARNTVDATSELWPMESMDDYSYYQAEQYQGEPLTSWFHANGMSSDKDHIAEQLRAYAPEAYED